MAAPQSTAGFMPVRPGSEKASFLRIAVPSFGGAASVHCAATEADRVSREEMLRIFGMDLRTSLLRAPAGNASAVSVAAGLPAELRPVPRRHPVLTDKERRDREISARIRQALYPSMLLPV